MNMRFCLPLTPRTLKVKYIYLTRKETVIVLIGVVLWCILFALLKRRRVTLSSMDNGLNVREILYTHRTTPGSGTSTTQTQPNVTMDGDPVLSTERIVQCNDTNHVKVMPPGTFPVVGLASFPGSGNTWVRYLIESATGYATGSVYHIKHDEKDFIGEMSNVVTGETIVFKIHDYWRGYTNKIDGAISMEKAILLMRNPYQALLDEFNRLGFGNAGVNNESRFKSEAWFLYLSDTFQFNRWLKLTRNLLDLCHHSDPNSRCKSLLIVYYEDLENNLEDELRRIMKFLDVTIDEHRISCTRTSAESNFLRPRPHLSFDPFTLEHHIIIDDHLNTFHQWLEDEGLAQSPASFNLNHLL